MGNNKATIEINGHQYDARTGQLLGSGPHAKPAKRPVMDVASRGPAPKVHKSPERSQTLMRHAVKKPKPAHVAKPTAARAPSDFAQTPTPSAPAFVGKEDAARAVRAQKIKQSTLVSRFNDFSSSVVRPLETKVQPLAVQPAPAHALPAPRPHHSSANALIAKGLRNASSHTEVHHKPKKTRKRGRLASVAAGGLAVLLLGGFFFYQNIPNMTMRYAAARSGVSARLPGYQPSGFALSNHIKYSPGQITLSFDSNSDDRSFTITQRESSWNSETLRQNYVANASSQVHNYEDKGQTIYLYGDSNATWVDGGVWYEINGNSGLNSDQLIRIATSM